jgi:hypothetical protein
MHRAQERFSAWTFVQALRTDTGSLEGDRVRVPRRIGRYRTSYASFGCLSGRNHSQLLRLALRGKWILDYYSKMARGKYEETIQFG